MTEQKDRQPEQQEQEQKRECGKPGGGQGRKDEVGGSGVYPMSGPHPPGPAEIRTPAAWGQGERGAAGYEDHGASQLTYEQGQLLGGLNEEVKAGTAPSEVPASGEETSAHIPADEWVMLDGDLVVPENARGVVIFAHGSGSSRHSPRNRKVARVLQEAGLATLLMDLLTPEEDITNTHTVVLRFDINLLARRLLGATRWLRAQSRTARLPLGYFGASTGAAAAIVAAAQSTGMIAAIVSRGGRPDLAGTALHRVISPTLLIVGGSDPKVLDLNRRAFADLPPQKRLDVIPHATHLFEEEGALEAVADLAKQWFLRYLAGSNRTLRAA